MKPVLNLQHSLIQSQKLHMSHHVQQALTFLQQPLYTLKHTIDSAMFDNPLLEIVEFSSDGIIPNNFPNTFEAVNSLSIPVLTLKDYLLQQVLDLGLNKTLSNACKYLVESLDHRGYLGLSLSELIKSSTYSQEDLEEALRKLQSLSPSGIGARNLCECLRLQLVQKDYHDPKLFELIDYHLPLLAQNKLYEIHKLLHVSMKQVHAYCKLIKSLEPKPSQGFANHMSLPHYVVPEATIIHHNDELKVVMNKTFLPSLTINPTYLSYLNQTLPVETQAYILKMKKEAQAIIHSIEKRYKTLYTILNTITIKQHNYIEGKGPLIPMTLTEIGNSLGLHTSTISRAIKDKYIQIPQKTILIKELFTKQLLTVDGDLVSSQHIKEMIRLQIALEDKKKPYSDQALANLLLTKNIKIARRTVAKYRESLKIPIAKFRKA